MTTRLSLANVMCVRHLCDTSRCRSYTRTSMGVNIGLVVGFVIVIGTILILRRQNKDRPNEYMTEPIAEPVDPYVPTPSRHPLHSSDVMKSDVPRTNNRAESTGDLDLCEYLSRVYTIH